MCNKKRKEKKDIFKHLFCVPQSNSLFIFKNEETFSRCPNGHDWYFYTSAFRPKSRLSIIIFDLLWHSWRPNMTSKNVWPEREVEHKKWWNASCEPCRISNTLISQSVKVISNSHACWNSPFDILLVQSPMIRIISNERVSVVWPPVKRVWIKMFLFIFCKFIGVYSAVVWHLNRPMQSSKVHRRLSVLFWW